MNEQSKQPVSNTMGQQVLRAMPDASTDVHSGKWRKHIASARIVWAKLTVDELLQSGGHPEKLTGLVQERYAISRETAHKKVESFLYQFRL